MGNQNFIYFLSSCYSNTFTKTTGCKQSKFSAENYRQKTNSCCITLFTLHKKWYQYYYFKTVFIIITTAKQALITLD